MTWKINGQPVLDGDVRQFIVDSVKEGCEVDIVNIYTPEMWWLHRWYFGLRFRFCTWRLNRIARKNRNAHR